MTKLALDKSLESIVGRENIDQSPSIVVEEIRPRAIIRPGSSQEAVECLRVCAETGAAVVPAGFGTWLECGNPRARADVVMSLERISRIIDYSPADLTATVEAGIALSDFNLAVMRERQWLPLDPPGASRASLGAVAACASFGSLRFGFGAIRDYVIGLRLAHADGEESRSGGKVVKNVAGYDMNKLYIGSFGTLAVITELTIKLRPLPDKSTTVLATSSDVSLLTKLAASILSSNLIPASVLLTRGVLADSSNKKFALAVRFVESEPTVKFQVEKVLKLIESGVEADTIGDSQAATLWGELADVDRRARVAIRISLPLSHVASGFEKLLDEERDCYVAADLATGIIRAAFDAEEGRAVDMIKKLRSEAALMGGTLVIERAPLGVKREADAWGDVGETVELMKAIKAKFDPQSLLNPGMFIAGI